MDAYTIRLHPAEEGGYWVSCDEVPGALTQGENVREALEMMGEAMALTLEDEGDESTIPPGKEGIHVAKGAKRVIFMPREVLNRPELAGGDQGA